MPTFSSGTPSQMAVSQITDLLFIAALQRLKGTNTKTIGPWKKSTLHLNTSAFIFKFYLGQMQPVDVFIPNGHSVLLIFNVKWNCGPYLLEAF